MTRFLLTVAALPALALVPGAAGAQMRTQAGVETNIENRIVNLETRIDAGVQVGAIDAAEARQLRRQARDLRQLQVSYSANGLTRQERTTLQQRARTLGSDIRMAGGSGWSNRYGWTDADLEDDSAAYAGARVGDVYYDGRGGPYEPAETNATTTRPGGILERLLGSRSTSRTSSNSGSFRIGDLISGVLGGSMNSGTTAGYRDRSDVYFRSDGRQVYEIDARTDRVVRIHPIR